MAPSCADKDFLLPLCLPLAKSSHWERICCSGLTMPSLTRMRPWRRFADLRLAYHNRSIRNLNLFRLHRFIPNRQPPQYPLINPLRPSLFHHNPLRRNLRRGLHPLFKHRRSQPHRLKHTLRRRNQFIRFHHRVRNAPGGWSRCW